MREHLVFVYVRTSLCVCNNSYFCVWACVGISRCTCHSVFVTPTRFFFKKSIAHKGLHLFRKNRLLRKQSVLVRVCIFLCQFGSPLFLLCLCFSWDPQRPKCQILDTKSFVSFCTWVSERDVARTSESNTMITNRESGGAWLRES